MKFNNKSKNRINNNIEDEESPEGSPSINLNTKIVYMFLIINTLLI